MNAERPNEAIRAALVNVDMSASPASEAVSPSARVERRRQASGQVCPGRAPGLLSGGWGQPGSPMAPAASGKSGGGPGAGHVAKWTWVTGHDCPVSGWGGIGARWKGRDQRGHRGSLSAVSLIQSEFPADRDHEFAFFRDRRRTRLAMPRAMFIRRRTSDERARLRCHQAPVLPARARDRGARIRAGALCVAHGDQARIEDWRPMS